MRVSVAPDLSTDHWWRTGLVVGEERRPVLLVAIATRGSLQDRAYARTGSECGANPRLPCYIATAPRNMGGCALEMSIITV
jgi:hypothetical protein